MAAYRIRPPPCPPPNRPAMSADEVGVIMSKIYMVIGVGVLGCVVCGLRANPSTRLYLTALKYKYQRWIAAGSGPAPVPITPASPERDGGTSLKFSAGRGSKAKPGRAKASSSSSSRRSGEGGSSRDKKNRGRSSDADPEEVPLRSETHRSRRGER